MTDKNKIQELGEQYGIDQETIDEVKKEYSDEPPLIDIEANVDPKTIPDAGQLGHFFERIMRLEEEKSEIGQDIARVYQEAKGKGFDVKVMRQILKLIKMDKIERTQNEFLRDEYKRMIGITD